MDVPRAACQDHGLALDVPPKPIRQSRPDKTVKARLCMRQSRPGLRQSRPGIRQSRPDYGLGLQAKGFLTFSVVPSFLGREGLVKITDNTRNSKPQPPKPGTYKTVKARFWPWLGGKRTFILGGRAFNYERDTPVALFELSWAPHQIHSDVDGRLFFSSYTQVYSVIHDSWSVPA